MVLRSLQVMAACDPSDRIRVARHLTAAYILLDSLSTRNELDITSTSHVKVSPFCQSIQTI